MTPEEMEKAVQATIEANDHLFAADDEHRIMIDVSGAPRHLPGCGRPAKGPERHHRRLSAALDRRRHGQVLRYRHQCRHHLPARHPSQLLDPKIKNRSRIHHLMANIEASQIAGDNNWALLDPDGFIAEAGQATILHRQERQGHHPEGRNILRGISRAYVIEELCPQLGIPVVETNIDAYDVQTADEAFATGTPFCMLPVTGLNGSAIGDGKVGGVFAKLLKQWGANNRWTSRARSRPGTPSARAVPPMPPLSLQIQMSHPVGIMQGRLLPLRRPFPDLSCGGVARRIPRRQCGWLASIEWIYEVPHEADNPLGSDEGLAEMRSPDGANRRPDSLHLRRLLHAIPSGARRQAQQARVDHLKWLLGQAAALQLWYVILPSSMPHR